MIIIIIEQFTKWFHKFQILSSKLSQFIPRIQIWLVQKFVKTWNLWFGIREKMWWATQTLKLNKTVNHSVYKAAQTELRSLKNTFNLWKLGIWDLEFGRIWNSWKNVNVRLKSTLNKAIPLFLVLHSNQMLQNKHILQKI